MRSVCQEREAPNTLDLEPVYALNCWRSLSDIRPVDSVTSWLMCDLADVSSCLLLLCRFDLVPYLLGDIALEWYSCFVFRTSRRVSRPKVGLLGGSPWFLGAPWMSVKFLTTFFPNQNTRPFFSRVLAENVLVRKKLTSWNSSNSRVSHF
jgi:hypothetical protein